MCWSPQNIHDPEGRAAGNAIFMYELNISEDDLLLQRHVQLYSFGWTAEYKINFFKTLSKNLFS